MQEVKKHIIFRCFTVLLACALFAPVVSKFVHVFEHHKHIVCKGNDSTHIHKVDLECEFYKFQLNHHFVLPFEKGVWLKAEYHYKISLLTNKFHNNHRHLSYSLRGPPVLV